MIPKLQLALDLTDLDKALSIAKKAGNEVDIIEVGTVLAIESGLVSVRETRKTLPQSKILADIRIIKAGGKLAKMAYDAGADIVTIMSDATKETFQAVLEQKMMDTNREVLIEINDNYTDDMLEQWQEYGLTHLIYHRGSEITTSNDSWSKIDFDEINRLSDLGFKVYVTGGIGLEEIALFEGVPVECFIIGRTIANAEDPAVAAKEFKNKITQYFKE